jgi:hypothetical protein
MTQPAERSAKACPVCGAHQLSLLEFPSLSTVGYQPYNEIVGMGEPGESSLPAIGCLACGAEWPDLAAFRQGAAGRSKPA